MPGKNIHRGGRPVPTGGLTDQRVKGTARKLTNGGRRARAAGGWDPTKIARGA